MNTVFEHLLKSSKFFAVEAVKNAVDAHSKDSTRWPLAMLHLVTSFELAAKALLAKQHPVFVNEKIEKNQKSVSIQTAFERLQSPDIYGLRLSDKDKNRISSAVRIRNGIAHGMGNESDASTEAKFFEVFAYLRDFFRIHLAANILDEVEINVAEKLLSITKQIREIEKRAADNIAPGEIVWNCIECEKEFLVERESGFVCLYCHQDAATFACQRCSKLVPEWEALSTEDLFEWEFGEGRANLVTNYGIGEDSVCSSCFNELQEEVNEMAREEEWRQAEEEYEFFMSRD